LPPFLRAPSSSMKVIAAFGLVCVASGRTLEADQATFKAWKLTHGRSYSSDEEEARRFEIFQSELDRIDTRNAEEGPHGAFYAPDDLADHSMEEFKALRVGAGAKPMSCLQSGPPSISAEEVNRTLAAFGSDIDWEKKGAVTPVKNQGSYGTCWSFSASGIMEGINVAQGGNPLEVVSEQELIDCSNCFGYVGCALSDYYIPNHLAAASEGSYPYQGSGGTCRRDSASLTKAKASQVICEPNGANNDQEHLVAQLITHGPFGFLVDASCLKSFANGIISNCGKTAGAIDHGTLAVGAGTENGVDYFRVKNSWGTGHGEAGYFRVKRSTNPPQMAVPGGIYGVYGSEDSIVV